MKLSRLSLADYNQLDNIPVINQDLTASGFTPVANTYYRHTGTTDTYTQGVIYYYDGSEYKALDGSGGGGTTLNKYTYQITKSATSIQRAERIFLNSKGKCTFFYGSPTDSNGSKIALGDPVGSGLNTGYPSLSFITQQQGQSTTNSISLIAYGIYGYAYPKTIKIKLNYDGTMEITETSETKDYSYVEYYNDTEIT